MIARARLAALAVIAVLVTAATLTSFAESYRGLFLWAHEHGVPDRFARVAAGGGEGCWAGNPFCNLGC